jgi:hypothetical protein
MMLFRRIGAAAWHVFDVACFIAAIAALDITAWVSAPRWVFGLAVAGTFALLGYLSELLAAPKGGDN